MFYQILLFLLVEATIITAYFFLKNQNQTIMATQAEFQEQLDRFNAATNAIADRLRSLEDQIANAGLPAEVEASVLEQLRSAADALEAVAATPEEPNPEV